MKRPPPSSVSPAGAGPLAELLDSVHRLRRMLRRECRHGDELSYQLGRRLRRAVRDLLGVAAGTAVHMEVMELRREYQAKQRLQPKGN